MVTSSAFPCLDSFDYFSPLPYWRTKVTCFISQVRETNATRHVSEAEYFELFIGSELPMQVFKRD